MNHLLDENVFAIRLKYLEERVCLYRPFLRPTTVSVMNRAIFSGDFAGCTDPSALSLLSAFVAICQPSRVLELGTYHGFSTLILADLLASNERPGRIVTVEPNAAAQAAARERVVEAGLHESVRFVSGRSTDEHVLQVVGAEAPFDMLYIDTSHHYDATIAELETCLVRRPLVRPGALIFLHDITFPMGKDRGVGPAVTDWLARHPEFHYLPLSTTGVWPNPCGLGILLAPATDDGQANPAPGPGTDAAAARRGST
jgi:predicted O-methyltransferase YrrM